jgi:RNA polymerase sigma-70 factor (ECF subfamily)
MSEAQSPFQILVQRAKSGDKDAFAEIYETHLTPVYRYLYVRLGSKEEAEDITQETFLKAYEAIGRFEATRDNFLPYLFTVARNLLINRGKKKRPDVHPPEELDREAGAGDTAWFTEQEERKETVRSALTALSETEREIVELRFFGERTYAEIAELCDKREDAVRQHIARAMKKMRTHMTTSELKSI